MISSLLLPTVALLMAAPSGLPAANNKTTLTRFCDAPETQLPQLVEAVASRKTLQERIADASERFLGVRYLHDPLGEGPGHPPDEDPLLRFDAVDCATFVDTVIALARSRDPAGLSATLTDLRYDGEVSYAQRNHFFVEQWLKANAKKGYVRDATEQLGGAETIAHTKVVTEQQWRQRRAAGRIRLPLERAPIGSFELHYVPLDKIAAMASRIPSGTIFTVVREDRPFFPYMVTHVGLIIQTDKGPVARHAGRGLYGQVVDEQLSHFLARNARYGKWRVLGFQLLEVLDAPGPHAAGL